MAFSQNLLGLQTPYPVVTRSCDVELCARPPTKVPRFYGETCNFKLNFSDENSNFSQFFVSGIDIHTFSHNFAEKNSFHGHFNPKPNFARGYKTTMNFEKYLEQTVGR